ncbi:MAG: hypothetical protein ACJARY_001335, partial [Candidatus Azotimanducaceae bacterium]
MIRSWVEQKKTDLRIRATELVLLGLVLTSVQ